MSGPLSDIRVIAIEQYGAGPFASMQLADLGADVVKIEDPSVGGDTGRYVPPYASEGSSLFFESFNRNKRSLSLDLRQPGARTVLEDLVRNSDALTSNLRGDQPAKLGLLYDDLKGVNPRIVCAALSAFGGSGPRAAQGGFDFTMQGIAGWMAVTGGPDQPPTKSGLSLVDYCAGYVTAIAVLAGIWQARRDGVGCDADISLFETALAQLTYLGTWVATHGYDPPRMADSAHLSMVPFQTFSTASGRIVISCPKENLWRRLCGAIERPGLADDERFNSFERRSSNREDLVRILTAELSRLPAKEWLARFELAGVPCGAVNDVAEALADPQVAARASLITYEHPILGEVHTMRTPFRLSTDGTPTARRGPGLGEHSDEVLRDVCGYDDEHIRSLREAGSVRDAFAGGPQAGH
jgi:crotonobetainyl-CoA:carnitine CoA-transferase CaiB-like acyl-CoA transferase